MGMYMYACIMCEGVSFGRGEGIVSLHCTCTCTSLPWEVGTVYVYMFRPDVQPLFC